MGLNVLDNHYGIKQKVKDGLNYAVGRVGELQQEFRRIDARRLGDIAANALGQVLDAARETAVDYAKDWVLRRLPGGIPEVPFKLPWM